MARCMAKANILGQMVATTKVGKHPLFQIDGGGGDGDGGGE